MEADIEGIIDQVLKSSARPTRPNHPADAKEPLPEAYADVDPAFWPDQKYKDPIEQRKL